MTSQSAFAERVRLRGNPVANPQSIVTHGQTRFTVLTSRLVRLEWSGDGVFEDRATFAFANRAAPSPQFTAHEGGGLLTIDTGDLVLRYRTGSGPFSENNLDITLTLNGEHVTWKPGMPNTGNLGGTYRTLDGAPSAVSVGQGLVSRDGWVLFDDSNTILFTEGGGWVSPRPDRDLQDWYFFGYGHDYLGVITEYTRFGGPVPLIPRFVLGSWWSRFWAYSDRDLKQLVDDFESHGLPLDVLVIDMDWHTPHSWTGYTWNRELFPDPEGFLAWAHSRGLQITLNLHPAEGVQSFEEVYPTFAEAVGIDPTTGETVQFRPGNQAFMESYFKILHHPMEEQGVDFWWLDWQQGEKSDMAGLDPLIWLNHLHFLDSTWRGRRPMLYSRWGGLGNHRYYIGFSGDTIAVWPALAFQPYFTATAANVLYGWWSHDIGGHFGAAAPELFARWVQFGALSPCLRLHSTKDPNAERRPWAFSPEVFRASSAAFQWRYRMVPYLYTMARVTTDTGIALCRPLYYYYPEDEGAYVARDAYFLGDSLLAAPIVRPANPGTGIASSDAWVPPGNWIDYQTGETFTGPRWVRFVGDLNRVPLLVREGSILPQARPAPNTSEIPADDLVLEVFPGSEGSFRIYEDDGNTLAYEQGQFEWTPVSMRTSNSTLCTLQIGPVEGRCDALPGARGYEVRFLCTLKPERVLVNNQEASDWTYDEAGQVTLVRVPEIDKRQPLTVAVEAAGGIAIDPGEHKRACILADVQRLLGDQCPQVSWEDLPAAVAALDHPGRADAVARLGGPWISVFENTTLPAAGEHLGGIVVAAPVDGTPFDITARWVLQGSAGAREEVQVANEATGDQILWGPFAFPGSGEPLRWEVEVTVRWRAGSLVHTHRSETLCPAVPGWTVAVYDPGETRAKPEQAGDLARQEAAGLEWQLYAVDPSRLAALTEAFHVELKEMYQAAKEGGRREALLAADVTSPDDREVRVAYLNPGKGECWLNGQQVGEASPGTAPQLHILPPMGREARVSEPVRLRTGSNTLVLRLAPESDAREWEYVAAAALVDGEGQVVTDLHYEIPAAE